MIFRTLRAALLATALGGVALAAQAQTPPASAQTPPASATAQADPAPSDPVVARVNGSEIRRSDVSVLLGQLPPQVQQMPIEMIYPAIIDQLVNQKLISDAGYKQDLQKTDEVKDEVKRAEERAVQRAFIQREVENRITQEALEAAYKDFLAHNPAQEEVKASHILVDTEAQAKDLIAQIKKGGDFAKLAREKSKDPSAAEQGGDLGYFTKDTMVEPFADAAFAMKAGEVSQAPVKTQFGWHVIKVEDKRTQPQPTLAEVRPTLEQELTKQIVTAMVGDLRTGATIETFQLDGTPMPAEPAK